MPIPYVLIGIAAVTGSVGLGSNIHAGVRRHQAKKIIEKAQVIYDDAANKLEAQRQITLGDLNDFGTQKLQVWSDDLGCYLEHFKRFKKVELSKEANINERLNAQIQEMDVKELAKVSMTAKEIAKGGVAVLGAGAVAGIATYGGAMLLGHASTGAAITALHGVAAKNATLAFLGGGAKAAGGLGVAGGGFAIGGVVFTSIFAVQGLIANAKAKERLAKAKQAYSEAQLAAEKMATVVVMLKKVSEISGDYSLFLSKFVVEYRKVIDGVVDIYNRAVDEQKKSFWNAIKNFLGIKFKLDFSKLSVTDQKYLQYSWLMTQILYQVLTSALMTEDGQIQTNAEKSLEDVKTSANRLLQAPQF